MVKSCSPIFISCRGSAKPPPDRFVQFTEALLVLGITSLVALCGFVGGWEFRESCVVSRHIYRPTPIWWATAKLELAGMLTEAARLDGGARCLPGGH